MNTTTYITKSEAIAAAKIIRANRGTAKVLRRSATYTEPGKGITAHVDFIVESN